MMSLHAELLETRETTRPARPTAPEAGKSSACHIVGLLRAIPLADIGSIGPVRCRVRAGRQDHRTLNHGEMRKVSLMIANNKLPKGVQTPSGGYITPQGVKTVANAFVRLQQARHEADYDLKRTFSRKQAIEFVRMAREAFEAWEKVKKTDDARLYLACFHLWKRWDEDPR